MTSTDDGIVLIHAVLNSIAAAVTVTGAITEIAGISDIPLVFIFKRSDRNLSDR